jgi:2,3-bisphosphoglycerate-independent phosphoglycerate mutase
VSTQPTRPPNPVVLCVLDGFGLNDDPRRNALLAADMPTWRGLVERWPHSRLEAAGTAVGLPAGQMGNSEVGHLNLGAGFRVLQDLPRISEAIQDGSFETNPALTAACAHPRGRETRMHILGLIGAGGIHAVDEHIVALVELAHRSGLAADRVVIHAFTDGRDTPPRSARGYLVALEERTREKARIGTVAGRYYAMDRDRRWERTKLAWDVLVHGEGLQAATAVAAVEEAYARGESDEFIRPTIVNAVPRIREGDAVVHMNFRADRARQLTQALALDSFDEFDRGERPSDLSITTLTEYQARDELPVAVAFPPIEIDSLAAYLSRLGLRQLHIAETEKYAHVTYFFDGGVEDPFPGEERILVPSRRDVPTYDLAPEMSAPTITGELTAAIASNAFDFVIVNYANPDMVGHTGVWDAAVRAAEVVDRCLGQVVGTILEGEGALLITGDHGNIEEMRDEAGEAQTKHTTSPVPLVLVGNGLENAGLSDGILADVAPTICDLMGIPPGPAMQGHSLLARAPATAAD